MSEPLPVGFPVPSPKDPEDVARALEGAAEKWREGAFAEALAEVELAAARAASVGENDEPMVSSKRVVSLAMAANDLASYVRKRALGTLRSAEPIAIDLLSVPSSSARSIDVPLDFSSSARSIDLTSRDVESVEPPSVPTPRVVTPGVYKPGPPTSPTLQTTLEEGMGPAIAAAVAAAAAKRNPPTPSDPARKMPSSEPPASFVGVSPKTDFTKTLQTGTPRLDQPRRSFTPARFNAVNVRAAVGEGTPLAVFFDAPTTRRADDAAPPSEANPSQPPTRRAEGVYPSPDLARAAKPKDPDGER